MIERQVSARRVFIHIIPQARLERNQVASLPRRRQVWMHGGNTGGQDTLARRTAEQRVSAVYLLPSSPTSPTLASTLTSLAMADNISQRSGFLCSYMSNHQGPSSIPCYRSCSFRLPVTFALLLLWTHDFANRHAGGICCLLWQGQGCGIREDGEH